MQLAVIRRGDLRITADGRAAVEPNAAAAPFRAADADRAAVLNAAAPHDEHTVVADTAASAAGHAALDGAAVHEERAVLLLAVAVYLHGGAVTAVTAVAVYLACGAAVDTGAVIHLEAAVFVDEHTAAAAAAALGLNGPAAHDAAAPHDKGTVLHSHTAAFFGAAAIDNAAGNGVLARRAVRQQRPQAVCALSEAPCGFVFRVHRVHHRQLSAAVDHKHAAAAGHFQHMVVQIEDKLARNVQRAFDVDIIRQPDARLAGAQLVPQFFLRVDISESCDPPLPCQGQVIRHLCAEVKCLSVGGIPAVKSIAVFGGVTGLPRHRAFLQKMLGVHRAVHHVRHSDLTGELDAGVDGAVIQHIARLLKCAAFDASALVVGHTAGKSGAAAAGDRAVAVHYSTGDRAAVGVQGAARAVHRAAVAGGCAAGINGAGVQLEHTLSAESHTAAKCPLWP